MVNNIGKTNQILSVELGTIFNFTNSEQVIMQSGKLGLGCLVFDPNGTMGTISKFVSENEFEVMTCAVSVDIPKILGESY